MTKYNKFQPTWSYFVSFAPILVGICLENIFAHWIGLVCFELGHWRRGRYDAPILPCSPLSKTCLMSLKNSQNSITPIQLYHRFSRHFLSKSIKLAALLCFLAQSSLAVYLSFPPLHIQSGRSSGKKQRSSNLPNQSIIATVPLVSSRQDPRDVVQDERCPLHALRVHAAVRPQLRQVTVMGGIR